MGITTAILRVKEHHKSRKVADTGFLMYSGAVYSLVPGKVLDRLEIETYRKLPFLWHTVRVTIGR